MVKSIDDLSSFIAEDEAVTNTAYSRCFKAKCRRGMLCYSHLWRLRIWSKVLKEIKNHECEETIKQRK